MPADAAPEAPAPVEPSHGWLAALLPEGARSVRVHDDAPLELALLDAGAGTGGARPDVEIGGVSVLEGDAEMAVVPIDVDYVYGRSRAQRAARRVARSTATSVRARRAVQALRRRGYPTVTVYRWDVQRGARSLADRFPQRAVVVGVRRPELLRDTILAGALRAAEATTGLRVGTALPHISGALVVVGRDVVVRTAVGPGRRIVAAQAAALAHAIRDGGLAPLAPAPLAVGRSGLGEWSAESRLQGRIATPAEAAAVEAASLDAAARLFALAPGRAKAVAADAEVVAPFVPTAEAEVLRALAERADVALADVRGGFAHGDFWSGNLLVADGRLTGIVDWEAAGPGRLPLVDFLQHRLNAAWPHHDLEWGLVIAERALPLARAGGDEPLRSFAARVGVKPDPALLEALVIGYWLDRLAYQLSTYAERRRQPLFLENNALAVVRALT
jgi:hypothetical protein